MKKLSFDDFAIKANAIHNSKYKYSKDLYENTKSKIEIICPIHGSFIQQANSHLNGCGCPSCYNDRRSEMQIFKKEDVLNKIKEIHKDAYYYHLFEYKGMNNKSTIACPIHGNFTITPSKIIHRKQGCPKCSKTHRLTTEEFIKKAKEIHGDRYDYSKVEYVNALFKIKIICPIHGEFEQTPHNHTHGKQGCPLCNESRLEKLVKDFLSESKIEYEYQKRFEWLEMQSLDFYLPRYNIAIECQGEQHYKPIAFFGGEKQFLKQLELDEKKKNFCELNGLDIIYFSDVKYKENVIIDLNEILHIIKK